MDIMQILQKHGVLKDGIEDSVIEAMNKDLRSNYKSFVEYNKIKTDLTDAQSKISKYETDGFEGKLAELQTKYDTDTKQLKDDLDKYKYSVRMDGALKGIEFRDTRAAKSVRDEIDAKQFKYDDKENKFTGLDDYLKDLYAKEPDTFKSVDSSIHTWGTTGGNGDNKPSGKRMSLSMKL